MAIEIERKFLVTDDGWKKDVLRHTHYRQGYLGLPDKASIRVRTDGETAQLNLKSVRLGASRHEFEYEIPLADARLMLDEMCSGPLVEKTRYYVRHGEHVWEVDVFEGDNAGLIVAEIELESEDESFEHPPWVGEDVTDQARYYNVNLVKHPYKDW